ncbi:MAG: glycine cleavage system protein GcvH [Planctomycetaceae bacterium]|nr:glycine cleavage system protein GcvH [Planctomycetaceae bacterium]
MSLDRSRLKFAKTHEWVHLEGNSAVIGISDFAVQALTDLVFMQLPAVGRALKPGEVFGEVESVKAVSDLYAPLAGTVTEVNADLPNNLEWLSEDPYGKGWILKLDVPAGTSLDNLMDPTAYEEHCKSESH